MPFIFGNLKGQTQKFDGILTAASRVDTGSYTETPTAQKTPIKRFLITLIKSN